MRGNPVFKILRKKSFGICVSAARQNSYKNIYLHLFAGNIVQNKSGVTRPVNFHAVAGLVAYVQSRFILRGIFLIMKTELRVHQRTAAFHSAIFAVFIP
jgi:hypothetical protein